MFFAHNTRLTIVLLEVIAKNYNMQMLSMFGSPSLLRPKGTGLCNGQTGARHRPACAWPANLTTRP
jgi:hypothetical protein